MAAPHSHWIHTMLRCARSFIRLVSAFACASAIVTALPAAAQMPRNFPATALRGEIVGSQPPELLLNGRPARLSPGARIRDEANLLQVSSVLAGQRLVVHYTVDLSGQVSEVWILTPDEAAKKPWPTTPAEAQRWLFDAPAQTWSKR